MKLFTKDLDNKLFAQFHKGADLENQMVVGKIFNPYGKGTWYLMNSDPEDPDYIWGIVDLEDVETGSISRSDLEKIRVKPFGLPLERDMYFEPINAEELYNGLLEGKQYGKGGKLEAKINGKQYEVDFDFTIGKWGGFDLGDGEYFFNNSKLFNIDNVECFIKCEKVGDNFETTFIPNPFNKMDLSDFTDQDAANFYKYAVTWVTSKDDVLKKLSEGNNDGVYEYINPNESVVDINDFKWYYLGLYASGHLKIKTDILEEHPEFKELKKLNTKYHNQMAKGGTTDNKWIQSAIKHPGRLRRHAESEGLIHGEEKLSLSDLHKLEKEGGRTAKEAHLAETLRRFDDGGILNPDDIKVGDVLAIDDGREYAPENLREVVEVGKGHIVYKYWSHGKPEGITSSPKDSLPPIRLANTDELEDFNSYRHHYDKHGHLLDEYKYEAGGSIYANGVTKEQWYNLGLTLESGIAGFSGKIKGGKNKAGDVCTGEINFTPKPLFFSKGWSPYGKFVYIDKNDNEYESSEVPSTLLGSKEKFGKGGTFKVPIDMKISGVYEVEYEGKKTTVNIAGFEAKDNDSQLLYQMDSDRNEGIRGLVVKNTVISRMAKGETVLAFSTGLNKQVKIKRMDNLFAKGGNIESIKDLQKRMDRHKKECLEIEPEGKMVLENGLYGLLSPKGYIRNSIYIGNDYFEIDGNVYYQGSKMKDGRKTTLKLGEGGELQGKVEKRFKIAKSQILADIADGTLPKDKIESFSDLHDYVDANMYGFEDENDTDDKGIDYDGDSYPDWWKIIVEVQDKLDVWIKSGGLDEATMASGGKLNEFTEEDVCKLLKNRDLFNNSAEFTSKGIYVYAFSILPKTDMNEYDVLLKKHISEAFDKAKKEGRIIDSVYFGRLNNKTLLQTFASGGRIDTKVYVNGIYQNKAENSTYSEYNDAKKNKRAKPAGWRYTNEGALRLKVERRSYVTLEHIKKYRDKYFTDRQGNNHRYIYIERRADKSDKKKNAPYLEKGGSIPFSEYKEFYNLWKSNNVTDESIKRYEELLNKLNIMPDEELAVKQLKTADQFVAYIEQKNTKENPDIFFPTNRGGKSEAEMLDFKNNAGFKEGGEVNVRGILLGEYSRKGLTVKVYGNKVSKYYLNDNGNIVEWDDDYPLQQLAFLEAGKKKGEYIIYLESISDNEKKSINRSHENWVKKQPGCNETHKGSSLFTMLKNKGIGHEGGGLVKEEIDYLKEGSNQFIIKFPYFGRDETVQVYAETEKRAKDQIHFQYKVPYNKIKVIENLQSGLERKGIYSLDGVSLRKNGYYDKGGEVKKDIYASGTMKTPDGIIKGTVEWNSLWNKYQMYIDGSLYAEFNDPEEGVDELKRSGFKDQNISYNLYTGSLLLFKKNPEYNVGDLVGYRTIFGRYDLGNDDTYNIAHITKKHKEKGGVTLYTVGKVELLASELVPYKD